MANDKNTYIKNTYGSLVGKTISKVRPLTENECKWYGWSPTHGNVPFAIIMTDLTVLVPSQDPEGNGAGHIFLEALEETNA